MRFAGFGLAFFPTSSWCWRGGVSSIRLSAASRRRSASSSVYSSLLRGLVMTIEEYVYWFPPTDAHLTAIGRVVVESAVLEDVIELAIWHLMGVQREVGEQVTNQPTLTQRLNFFFRILPKVYLADADQRAFEPIKQELKAVAAIRNHLIHASWAFGTRQDTPISVNHRNEKGEIVPRTKKWKAPTIERVAARIGRVGDELIAYLEDRGASLPPSSSRSWKQYQVPPEPKWPSKKNRVRQRPPQSFQP